MHCYECVSVKKECIYPVMKSSHIYILIKTEGTVIMSVGVLVMFWWEVIWRMGANRKQLNLICIRAKTHYIKEISNGFNRKQLMVYKCFCNGNH